MLGTDYGALGTVLRHTVRPAGHLKASHEVACGQIVGMLVAAAAWTVEEAMTS